MIVGIQESFIDYPNQICVMMFSQTCSWDCPNCYNKQNLSKGKPLSINYIRDYLLQSGGLTKYVTISGGEPTEDSDVPSLIRWLHENGYHIKLDTNGSNVDVLSDLLPYLDVVAMDVKVNPDDPYLYHRLTRANLNQICSVKESIDLLSDWYKSDPENRTLIFRTTLFTDYIDTDQIEDFFKKSEIEYSDYIVQDDIRSKSGR